MKRLIFILAVVCTVFIGFGSVGYAFEKGDTVAGITLRDSYPGYNYYLLTDKYLLLFDSTDVIYNNYVNYLSGTANGFCIYSSGSSAGACGARFCLSSSGTTYQCPNAISLNFDICDSNGNVVFPQTPPAEVPEVTKPGLEGITTDLLLGVLQGLKPILLGLAVSVIGFLAFRKAWNWVLIQLHLG